MWIAGVMQGLMWRATNGDGTLTYTFVESLAATYPYYLVRLIGGLLVLAGMFVMAWNMLQTSRMARTTADSPVLAPAVEAHAVGQDVTEHAHARVERTLGLMAVLIAVVISFGGLAEIVPLMYQAEAIEPLPGVKPYPPLQLAGRDVYVREGCYNCHSQMVRTLRFETERYGHYSLAGESVYDRPFQWGSKRTGPDLARVGARYSNDWHRAHLANPRDVVPESNMPGYPWMAERPLDASRVVLRMQRLRMIGDPYSDEDIAGAPAKVEGKTEMDAVIAYLQGLGIHGPRGR
jgi:cytochrome c oxidase cbb3-type subunit 2